MSSRKSGYKFALLIGSVLISLAYTWCFLYHRTMPWWSDPGEWLKYANAIEAYIGTRLGVQDSAYDSMLYTMWDQGVFQYPPLFFIILVPLKAFLGPLLALKVLGSTLFALQPIPIYFITRKVSGSEAGGIAAAYTTSLMPFNIEMLGWGGYPNLMGLLLLAANLYFTIALMDRPSKKGFCLMALTSALIPLTHHLTLGIHLGVLSIWIAFLAFSKRVEGIRYPVYNLIIASATLASYRLSLANPSQFITFNEAAYYSLRVNFLEALAWAFKSPLTFIAMLAIIVYLLVKGNRALEKRYKMLILTWALFPVIATQAYLLHIAIDYNRIFFFMIQPMPVIVGLPLTSLNKVNVFDSPIDRSMLKKNLTTIVLLALVATASASTFFTGAKTMEDAAGWYSSQDPYGDEEKASALQWIKDNTPYDSTFVADEYIGRWIEGYTSRRTLLYMEPKFLFVKGQLERYYIASAALLGEREIRNAYLRILDQTPYNLTYSPIACFWSMGEYKDALSIDDSKMLDGLKNLTVNSKTDREGAISIHYSGIKDEKEIKIEKTIRAKDYMMEVGYKQNLHNITIYINLSRERQTKLIEVSGNRVQAQTDIGKIIIETNAKEIECEGDKRIRLSYDRDSLKILGYLENPTKNSLDQTIVYETRELLKENGVSYMVIPRTSSARTETLPEYQHLLKAYKTVYSNNKVIILKADED